MARIGLYEWCQEHGERGQQLLQEWTGLDEDNNPIDINEVSYGSGKKVQWECKEGHNWLSAIYSRTYGRGCPYCSKNRVSVRNSLKIWCKNNKKYGQQLLQEWTGSDKDFYDINIHAVSCTSKKKVYWRCEKGHLWTESIVSRVIRKRDCPYCVSLRED